MPMYDRSASSGIEVVDRWADGVGWIAHPGEESGRTSHAIRGEDGVWVFDPLDGPGVGEVVAGLGPVAGVAVLSSYHARDAAAFAERHDVAVHLPAWMDRVAGRVGAPIERYPAPPGEWVELGDSGISVRTIDPSTAWREVIAFRPADGTLLVADVFGTQSVFTVGDERLGCFLLHRLAPPRAAFAGVDPERVLVGHGEGISDDAAAALESTLDGARRRVPRALVSQAPDQIRAVVGAVGD